MTKLWQQLEPTHKLNLLLPALKYKLRTSDCFISKVLPQSFCDIQMVSLTKLDSFFRLQENGALEHQQWQLIFLDENLVSVIKVWQRAQLCLSKCTIG